MATSVPKSKWEGIGTIPAVEATRNFVSINYEGKKPEDAILRTLPGRYVRIYSGGERDNRLYFGENLKALAALLNDPAVAGKVELVYIDPPFATGGVFKSRKQENAYADLLQGVEYIEFMRRRLILLRELLSDTGSIYVHLDENMVFAVKLIMDEIFGRSNFRNMITRKKCNPKNYTRKTYGNISDYILFYTKSGSYTWNRPFEPWSEEDIRKEYPYIDKKTGRRYKKVPIHAPGTRNGETGQPWRGMLPPPGKHWQYTPAKLEEMDRRGEIYWSPTGNPRKKVFLDESRGKPVQDIWLDVKDAHNQNIRVTGYPTEKNPALLERIIRASSNPGDVVLDCFCGSGTTLAVAEDSGRRWIGVDNSLQAITAVLKRFAVGTEMMGDFVSARRQVKSSSQMALFHPEDRRSGIAETTSESSPAKIRDFSFYCEAEMEKRLSEEIHKWLGVIAA